MLADRVVKFERKGRDRKAGFLHNSRAPNNTKKASILGEASSFSSTEYPIGDNTTGGATGYHDSAKTLLNPASESMCAYLECVESYNPNSSPGWRRRGREVGMLFFRWTKVRISLVDFRHPNTLPKDGEQAARNAAMEGRETIKGAWRYCRWKGFESRSLV